MYTDKKTLSVADAVTKIMEAEKMAKKDHDQDGKIETGKAEYLGSRIRAAKMAGKLKEDEELDEASYSAKAARAGKDIGKPGKQFSKIAKSAAERYGSEEKGKKVAGSILAKLRKEETEHIEEGGMPSSVIKHKQSLATKSPEELHAGFKEVAKRMGKSIEHVARSTAWSHGYGKGQGQGSSHYYDKIKHLGEEIELDEAFPTIADGEKSLRAKEGKTSKGTVTKTKTGLVHSRDYEDDSDDTPAKKGRPMGSGIGKSTKKKKLSEMIAAYKEKGIDSLYEEPDNETFTKELKDQEAKMNGKKKGGDVAKPSVQAVKMEEVELEEYEYISEAEYLELDEDEQQLWEAVTSQSYSDLRDKKSKVPATEFGAKGTKTKVLDQIRSHESRKKHSTGKNVYATDYKVGKKDTTEMMYRKKSGKKGQVPSQRAGVRRDRYDEAVEQMDERTLTAAETANKEDYVKGMKKSVSGFKSRYGDRAKEVMYATATKMAKKD